MMLHVKSPLSDEQEALVTQVVDVGYTVHVALGPGFKEVIYHRAFCLELEDRHIPFETEKKILVPYKRWQIPGQKVDLIIAGAVLVELKAVPKLRRIHEAQVRSYLKATNLKVGLLMNFNRRLFKRGCHRVTRQQPQ